MGMKGTDAGAAEVAKDRRRTPPKAVIGGSSRASSATECEICGSAVSSFGNQVTVGTIAWHRVFARMCERSRQRVDKGEKPVVLSNP
jgi:hypothetical protein